MVGVGVDRLHRALERADDARGDLVVDGAGDPPRALLLHPLANQVLVLADPLGQEPDGIVEERLVTVSGGEQ